jgi:plastocyanin
MMIKPVLAAVSAALSVGALVTLPASAAPSASHVQYVKVQRSCAAARPGHAACFALKLVRVAKGTPGAKPMTVAAPSIDTGPAGGYAPIALARAYGYDPTATLAKPQIVAIVDAHDNPHALGDLNTFNANYSLPAETTGANWTFKKVNQGGHASPLPTLDKGWSREISLDLQAVRGACNNCRILLVEAKTSNTSDLAAAVNTAARLGATEISNSYGGPEVTNVPATIKNAYNHPGIVITASTGDDGWFSWDLANNGGRSANRTNTPAAYPTVVAVTGTALTLNADDTRNTETVWNENGLDNAVGGFSPSGGAMGASGGGCSSIYNAQTWQRSVSNYVNMGCASGKRVAADVAADADPQTGYDIFNTFDGGWETMGGTSLSSPLVAAMWALAGGAGSEKYPAKSLYDRLRFTPGSRSDITVGGNSWCAGDGKTHCSNVLKSPAEIGGGNGNPNNLVIRLQNGTQHRAGILDCGYKFDGTRGTLTHDAQCYAKVGYDGASGVGAPTGLSLFVPTKITVKIGGPSPVQVHVANQWTATNFADGIEGAMPVGYKWTWGDGTVTNTTNTSASHTFGHTGTFTVTLTVTDTSGQKGTVTRTIKVTT